MKSIRKIELKYSRTSLVKDGEVNYSKQVFNSQGVSAIARSIIGSEVTEVMIALHLNAKNKIIGYSEVAKGGTNECSISPADVFRPAIVQGALKVILSHNHPSNEVEPSPEDVAFTKRICKAGKLLGIEVVDHIIVTEDSYYSFLDSCEFMHSNMQS